MQGSLLFIIDEVCSFPLIICLYHKYYRSTCCGGLWSRRHVFLYRDRKTHHKMQSKHMPFFVHSPHSTRGVWITSKSMGQYFPLLLFWPQDTNDCWEDWFYRKAMVISVIPDFFFCVCVFFLNLKVYNLFCWADTIVIVRCCHQFYLSLKDDSKTSTVHHLILPLAIWKVYKMFHKV